MTRYSRESRPQIKFAARGSGFALPRSVVLPIMRALAKTYERCLASMNFGARPPPGDGRPLNHEGQRAQFVRTMLLQAVVLLLFGATVAWLAPQWAWVTVAGGAIALVANCVFGALALVERRGAGAVIAAFWVAEVGKFMVVAGGFALLFRNFPERFDDRVALLPLGAFALTLSAPLALALCRTRGRR